MRSTRRFLHLALTTSQTASTLKNFTLIELLKAFAIGFLEPGEVGFVYAGLHGIFQGLDQVIKAAMLLKKKPVRFLLFGDGPDKERLKAIAAREQLTNIDFHSPLAHKDMPAVLASMDVALITLKTQILGAVPSKIYEAMASGIPILLVAGGEAAGIVQKNSAGLVVAPDDTEALVKTAILLADNEELRLDLGKAGCKAAEKYYDRAEIARRFEAEISL